MLSGLHPCHKGLRHGFGVQAVSASIPLNLLPKMLDHSMLSTMAIYADAIGEEEQSIATECGDIVTSLRGVIGRLFECACPSASGRRYVEGWPIIEIDLHAHRTKRHYGVRLAGLNNARTSWGQHDLSAFIAQLQQQATFKNANDAPFTRCGPMLPSQTRRERCFVEHRC